MSDFDIGIDGGPKAAWVARKAIDSIAGKLDAETLHVLRLLTTELVTNSVRHGRTGPEGSVRLKLKLTKKKVRVEVRDTGPGFEAREPKPAEDRGSGYGLFFVDRMADRWGSERKSGAFVWFELDR
jgi:anti-sigma regulatory factor (Ser/Thr protein kinase)